ncbi:MAG: hypothetical protein R3B06_08885 [Kofleriaceae bacterium]
MHDPDVAGHDHWPRHARQWARVGPPLRPVADDVAVVEALAATCPRGSGRGPRVAVLGVTPELVAARWPAGTTLLAIERAAAVIAALYPRAGAPAGAVAVQGDWLALPVGAAGLDLIAGDGATSNLVFPDGYRALAGEVARALAPGGRLCLRLFTAPPVRESLADVGAALAAGSIGSFHAFKWRVAMAIQPAERNVAVAAIRDAVVGLVPDRAALAAHTGWARDVIDGIDVYRGSTLRYSFPAQAEVEAVVAERLALIAVRTPRYELGERCPTLIWAAR